MMKNKVFIVTNVLGLGIAISICIVTYLAYQYDSTFDVHHQNREQIYRISSVRDFENTLTRFGYAPLPLVEITKKSLQDVDKSSAYLGSGSNFKRGTELFSANASYVDPEFFHMFSFEFIVGGNRLNKTDIFISESMAIRLFKTATEALDKNITQVYGTQLKELRVAGVFREPPMNTSFYKPGGSSYLHIDNHRDEFSVRDNDWREWSTVYVQIDHADRVKSLQSQLQPFIANNNNVREDFQLAEFVIEPFTSMAHADRDDDVRAATWQAPPAAAIVGAAIMGLLILLIACFNLTNTAIAISSQRLKEIGIRKTMGSHRYQIIIQFIGETTAICFVALIVGLALSDFIIQGWNLMTDNNIHLESNYWQTPGLLLFLTGVLLFTGILAGSYPAFYISRFQAISIFKGKLKFGGTTYFSRTLLGLQFSISLMAIISAITFMQNAKYQREYDLGFDVRGSVIASLNDPGEFDTYKNALASNPKITSVAGASSGIFSYRLHEPVKHESAIAEVDIIEVGDEYLQTMGLTLLKGRNFTKHSQTDSRESVIITQKMADMFKLENPIGKEIVWRDSLHLHVIGVVKDVYTQGLWREMDAMMIKFVLPEQYTLMVVSAKAEDVAAVNAEMNKVWNEVFPNRMYTGYMLDSSIQQVTALNTSVMYAYSFLGLIATLLSATGLYTLFSLNILRRMKEIGIRKIVGASVFNITRVVNKEFVIVLILASVFGSVLSYNWCNIVMGSIWRYHQSINVWSFVFGIGLLFLVSFATISRKLLEVASMNPAQTLRDD